MSTTIFKLWTRWAVLPVTLAVGFVQAGCAHPVVMEPSVAISTQLGSAPVYAQIGFPTPMVLMPPPRVMYAPPPVVYAPPVYQASPAWGWGRGHHPWGAEYRGGHHGHGGREHGWR